MKVVRLSALGTGHLYPQETFLVLISVTHSFQNRCLSVLSYSPSHLIVYIIINSMWASQLSWYNDWLRSGRSGDRIPVGGEIFRTCPDRLWGPLSLLYNGYWVFPGVNNGLGVTLTPHPLLLSWSWKSRTIPLPPLMCHTACTEPQCLYKGALYSYLIIISIVQFVPSGKERYVFKWLTAIHWLNL